MGISPQSIDLLHVDDESDLSELAAEFMNRVDDRISIDTATNASDGEDLLLENDYDCVVSDYGMPGRDGVEFLNAVRQEFPDLPFILYTGKGSEEVASEAIAAGVTDYLQKESGTSQYEVLVNRIRNAVESRRAGQTVRENLEWSSTLLEYSSDYLFVVDTSGVLSYVSPSVKRVLGYTPEEVTEASAFEFTHPEDIEMATEAFAEILERPDEDVTAEFRTKHADGSYRWLEVRGRNLLDDSVIEGILVNARDITERKEREQDLRQQRAFIDESLDALDDLYFVLHETGELFRWNKRLREVTGYTDDELAAMEPTDFFPEEDHQRILNAIQEVLETGTSRVKACILTKDGARIPHEIRGTRLSSPNGDGMVITGVGRDITEQREHEARLEEFASVVSHDLRNPLTVAQGRVELLADDCASEHLVAVENAHDRMEELITDMLTVAREGVAVTDFEPVDVSTVLDGSWRNVGTADAVLITEIDREIHADASRLQQVFENLFRNAIEHGGDEVTVTVGELEGGFYVGDDGPGIPEADRVEVLEAGYSTTDHGTGFGLSIVKEIVRAHDWEISVTNGANGGAQFEITGVEFAAV